MTRDQALKAIDDSFDSRVDNLGQVFIDGMIDGLPIAELIQHFDRGFELATEMHDRLKAEVEKHFGAPA